MSPVPYPPGLLVGLLRRDVWGPKRKDFRAPSLERKPYESDFSKRLKQSARGHSRFLDHQDRGDDPGRDGRRRGVDVDASGLRDWQRYLYRHLYRRRRCSDRVEVIPPVPVLGRDHRDHDSGHDDGGLFRSLPWDRLCWGVVDPVRAPYGLTRRLVLVGRLRFG